MRYSEVNNMVTKKGYPVLFFQVIKDLYDKGVLVTYRVEIIYQGVR
jgi:hypothetical protein